MQYGKEATTTLENAMERKSLKKTLAASGQGGGKKRRAGGEKSEGQSTGTTAGDPNSTSSATGVGGGSTTITKPNGPLFEPKQEHESMRAFNRRIKEETRIALKEDMEVLGTSARKKEVRLAVRRSEALHA